MGRSPCCDKVGLKKGPWTPEEDQKLLAYIEEHGHGSWRALPAKAGLQRCGKSCRLRWTNYLRPDIKRGKFSLQEEQTIIQLHALLGNRWSGIATHLPKRTDNEIKNYWNTHLKKRLAKMGIDPVTHKPKNDALLSNDGQTKDAANLSHMAQWESARLEAEARLVRESKLRSHSLIHQQQALNTQGACIPSFTNSAQPPMSLDVLKSWSTSNVGWSSCSSSSKSGVGSGDHVNNGKLNGGNLNGNYVSVNNGVDQLESPTSTLTFSETNNHNATQKMNISPTIGDHQNQNSIHTIEFVGSSSSSGQDGLVKEEGELNHEWKGDNLPENSVSFTSRIHDHLTMSNEGSWIPESLRINDSGHVHGVGVVEGDNGFTNLLLNDSGDRVSSLDNNGKESDRNDGACEDYYEDNKNYWNSILNLVNSSPSSSPMF